jgi:hypothetical protein
MPITASDFQIWQTGGQQITVGPTGQGITWRGTWSNSTAYAVNDAVARTNQSYICTVANTGKDPATDTTHWNLMAAQGGTGSAGPPGPTGPSAVSANANNKATLGTDSLILVQGTATGLAAITHAQTVSGDDPQLTNARTPTAHQATHNGGSDAIPLASAAAQGLCPPVDNTTIQVSGGKLVAVGGGSAGVSTDPNNKATLGSDSKILVQGTASGVAATTHAQTVSGDDPQLTNARTPTAHHTTHEHGGTDAVSLTYSDLLAIPVTFAPVPHEASHVTGGDQIPLASSSAKGLMNQTSGNTTDFIDGTNNSQPLQPVIWSVRLRSFNAIGNPTCEVDQRSVGAAVTNLSTLSIDRWQPTRVGTMSVTAQQLSAGAGVGGGVLLPGTNFVITGNFLRITLTVQEATLGAGDLLLIQQAVEGPRWRELMGDAHSVQVLVRSSVAGLRIGLGLRDANQVRSLLKLSPAGLLANTFTLIPFPNIPIWPSGGGFTSAQGAFSYYLIISLACGSTYTAPANDVWQNTNLLGALGQSNFCASPVNSTFDLAFVEHEPGALCTTPIDLSFLDNLQDCKRYFQKTWAYGTAVGTPTSANLVAALNITTTQCVNLGIRNLPSMAKAPTVTPYSYVSGTPNTVRDALTATDSTVASVGAPDVESPFVNINTSGTALNVGGACYVHYKADTGW